MDELERLEKVCVLALNYGITEYADDKIRVTFSEFRDANTLRDTQPAPEDDPDLYFSSG